MVHQLVEYEPGKPFSWFPEEVAGARREADKDPLKKQLGDVAALKGNSFYGKMIEDLGHHKSTKFTREERNVDKALRSPFFDSLEEISGAYEIRELKRTVMLKRSSFVNEVIRAVLNSFFFYEKISHTHANET